MTPSREDEPGDVQAVSPPALPQSSSFEKTPRAVIKALVQRPVFELGVLFAATLAYCSMFLKFGAEWRLPGNEAELFQSFGLVLYQALIEGGKFPLWNPYIRSGLPFVADPMLYIYNPLISIPILLFGPWDGFKLALLVHFLLAGWGMWCLCQTLGINSPVVRVWVALLYVFAGQPVARFFQGEYLFVFGFAWIPWIVHHLFQVARAPRRSQIVWAALSLAMLYFCGNAYYPFLMLFVVALFLLLMAPVITWGKREWKSHPRLPALRVPRLDWRQTWQRTTPFLLIGGLALGLIAIHFIPQAEFWPRLSKGQGAYGSHNLGQILLDFTSKDSYRPDAYEDLPAREEFYAYIGWGPILALASLPLAFRFRPRKPLLFLLLVLAFVVVYIDLKDMPWRDWYEKIRILSQFRHLLRPLIFGSFAILLLGGIGLDEIWQRLVSYTRQNGFKRVAAMIALPVLGTLMLWSVRDIYITNRPHLAVQNSNLAVNRLANWLREDDASEYTVRFNPTNAALYAILDAELRFSQIWYPLDNFMTLDYTVTERSIPPAPNYILQASSETAPDDPSAEMVHEQEGYQVYRLPESLPLAFTVAQAELNKDAQAGPLRRAQVFPLLPFFPGPNQAEIVADSSAENVLVLLVTYDPGWHARVDGDPATVKNVGGYLGVDTQRGVHKYTFSYRPFPFYTGLVITLATSVLIVFMLSTDLRRFWCSLRERGRTCLAVLRQGRSRLQTWWQVQQPQSRLAVYQEGALNLESPLELADQTQVRVTIDERISSPPNLREALCHWLIATARVITTLVRAVPLPTALFILGLVVYLLTRLDGLADWPIYFFTDEAVQTVMAEDFLHNGLSNYNGEVLPTYFNKDATYNLSSLSVYLQVIPYLLFGKSVFVTRAVSVLAATFGAVMVGLILRDIFKLRYWWSGVLLLSVMPAWFLHSRTAFETVEMTAFYAGFLYFYLRYRTINPRALYAALVFGAMVFYTYSPGQLIIVVSGVFLLLSDLRYHLQQRKVALRGLLLLVVLALPYLRYYMSHPEATLQHLSTRAPYWAEDIPLGDKLMHYLGTYLSALNPRYWFLPNLADLDRHLMKGYGHLSLWMLPLVVLGLGTSLYKVRSPAYRGVLLALLAAPTGSALVGVGITRLLVMFIPLAVFSGIGLSQMCEWLVNLGARLLKRLRKDHLVQNLSITFAHTILALLLAGVLCLLNLNMLRDARVNGPLWYQDYTLGGMQYGARQLFSAVIEYYEAHPGVQMIVSTSWTNGADAVAEFFLPEDAPVQLGSVEGHIFQRLPLDDSMVFVVIPYELEKVQASDKFAEVQVEQVLEYPNGEPGFYFIRLHYVDQIDAILEAEREARRVLQETTLSIDGQSALVRYSMLDMGIIDLVFDGNPTTVARTLEANPFLIELDFLKARPVSSVTLALGSAYLQVRVLVIDPDEPEPVIYETMFRGSVADPEIKLDFGRTLKAEFMRFEILAPGINEPTNVHVWEITLQK